MRRLPTWIFMFTLAVAGCGVDNNTDGADSSPAGTRGGTITVGNQAWTIVPSTQCSIYPGNVVHIAGHAAEEPALEIIIDYGGPTGARIGSEFGANSWEAVRETLRIEIDGRRIHGAATFNQSVAGATTSAEGSFDVTC